LVAAIALARGAKRSAGRNPRRSPVQGWQPLESPNYWDEYTEDSLTAAGFRREGTTFQKDIVTGSTITSPVIRELREIQQYQDMLYETPDLETASGIRNYGLVYDFDAVQALIANATKVVEAEEERVFGTGVREWRAKGGAWAERDEAPDLSKKKEQEKGWQNRGDGLFGKHVGYAPVYKSGYDVDMEKSRTKNIKYKGSGELGRILGYLSWYNMEEGAGYSQVNQPAWDKPLWDAYPLFGNEDWMMEAPSLAGAVDLVVQVVATVATAPVGGWGGAALGAAIGSVDDLLFTALELGTGYIIPEQALLQVGQTLLKAGVQTVMSGVMNGFDGADALNETANSIAQKTGDTVSNVLANMDPMQKFGLGGLMGLAGDDWLGKAGAQFFNQLVSNTANAYIDSHSLEVEDGKVVGWHFDGNRFKESVVGERALAGYAGSFVGSAVTAGMNNITLTDGLGELLPDEVFGKGFNFNNFIGSYANQLTQSLITGEFTINVLNLKDIMSIIDSDNEHISKMDMGLLEFSFSGKGIRTRAGQGGFNVSATALGDALSGLGDIWYGIEQKYLTENGNQTLNLMNFISDLGLEDKQSVLMAMRNNKVEFLDDAEHMQNLKTGTLHLEKDLLHTDETGMLQLASEVYMQVMGADREEAFNIQKDFLNRFAGAFDADYKAQIELIDAKIQEIHSFEQQMESILIEEVGLKAYMVARDGGLSLGEIVHDLPEEKQIELYEDLYDQSEANDDTFVKDQFQINLIANEVNLAFDMNILKAAHFSYHDQQKNRDNMVYSEEHGEYRNRLIPYGYEHVTEEMLETDQRFIDAGITMDDLRYDKTVFSAELFIREKDGELDVIIAYMGTTQDSPMDNLPEGPTKLDMILAGAGLFDPRWKIWEEHEWIETNVQNQRGFLADQYERATQLALKIEDKLTQNVILTGHSQGGGEARLASIATGFRAIVYNSAALHSNIIQWGKVHGQQLGNNHYLNIRQYDTTLDALNGPQDMVPWLMNRNYGMRISVPGDPNPFGVAENKVGEYNHMFNPLYEWYQEKMGIGGIH
jgi:hypothetical protein